jgi:hypothetical protein
MMATRMNLFWIVFLEASALSARFAGCLLGTAAAAA